jgi:rod shape-determining protein MreC
VLFAMLAIALMYIDQRKGWLESARYGLQAAAFPIQAAANSPSSAWHALRQWLRSRDTLRAEIERLQLANKALALRAMRVETLELDNSRLRQLGKTLPPLVTRWEPAEIISAEFSGLRQRFVIARGARDGVFKGQAVLGASGVLGQVLRTGPFSAEVMLLTDPEHAMPVMVARNGLRTLAVGSGTTRTLTLPYLPAQSDVVEGDLLVSSGLGGVFPAGMPVATVTRVRRDGNNALATIDARMAAPVDHDREVAIVWFNPANPAAPAKADPMIAAEAKP